MCDKQNPVRGEHAPAYGSDEWWDLQNQIIEIHELARGALPMLSGLRCELRHAYLSDSSIMAADDEKADPPTAGEMRKAIAFFFSLPPEEQRRIYNGWEPDRDAEPLAATLNRVKKMPRHAALAIQSGGRHGTNRKDVSREYRFDDTCFPLTLLVRVGTPRAEVLDFVDSLERFIDGNWESLITQDPHEQPFELRKAE